MSSAVTPVLVNDAMPKNMQAAYLKKYGADALEIGELPCPTLPLDANHVLLKVHCVAIDTTNVKMRNGEVKVINGKPSEATPIVIGFDCSGVIVSLGSSVPDTFKVGDAVMGVSTTGALSEYALLHVDQLVKKPDNVSFSAAAGMITSGVTALQAFQYVEEVIGKKPTKVLVTGGAGGLGHLAIQIAKNVYKATLVATTASTTKVDFCKEMGADVVILPQRDGGNPSSELKKDFDMALDTTKEVKLLLTKTTGLVISTTGLLVTGKMLRRVISGYRQAPPPGCVFCCLDCCSFCCTPKGSMNIVAIPLAKDLNELAGHASQGLINVQVYIYLYTYILAFSRVFHSLSLSLCVCVIFTGLTESLNCFCCSSSSLPPPLSLIVCSHCQKHPKR